MLADSQINSFEWMLSCPMSGELVGEKQVGEHLVACKVCLRDSQPLVELTTKLVGSLTDPKQKANLAAVLCFLGNSMKQLSYGEATGEGSTKVLTHQYQNNHGLKDQGPNAILFKPRFKPDQKYQPEEKKKKPEEEKKHVRKPAADVDIVEERPIIQPVPKFPVEELKCPLTCCECKKTKLMGSGADFWKFN